MSSSPIAVMHNMHARSVHVNPKIPETQDANHTCPTTAQR